MFTECPEVAFLVPFTHRAPAAYHGPMAVIELADPSGPPTLPDYDRRAERIAAIRGRLAIPMPSDRWAGWLTALGITAFAAALRLKDLGTPAAVVFDETYYLKGGLSLLRYGYEVRTVDGADKRILAGDLDVFNGKADFVVHPPLGKWVIAAGEQVYGVNPFGWRIGVAILGIIAVLMVARITRRLTRSTLIGSIAGLLFAIDGMAIVHSRTALLDQTVMFTSLAAFGCLLLDRDSTRRRMARLVEQRGPDRTGVAAGLGPWLLGRPWRVAAGVFLGLTIGTKWSGLWFLALFALLSIAWDSGARRIIGVRRPTVAMLVRDAIPAFVSLVVVALAVYLVVWTGWFLSDDAWDRQWAASHPGEGLLFLPEAIRSLWHYHVEAWNFHVGLTSPHSYQSNPWSWPIQGRPTSFFYESYKSGDHGCTVESCSAAVTALGNPIVWWAGTIALLHQAWRWAAHRDWRSAAVVVGFIAGWAPWLLFQNRTVFTFYAIAMLPFLVMALAMTLGTVLGPSSAPPNRRMWGALLGGGFLLLAIAVSAFFYAIWVGETVPYDFWHIHMWFPSWV